MNRQELTAIGVAAAVVLVGTAGVFGALGPSSPSGAGPADRPTTTHLVYETDALTVAADDGQIIRGETPLEPGTGLVLRVQSSNSSRPFARSIQVVVREDGTFDGTFDLSPAQPGSEVRVRVIHDGRELVNTTAAVVASDGETDGTTHTEAPDEDTPDAAIDHDGDALTLASASEQVVSGTTDLEPGSEVVVRLRSSSGEQPFAKQRTATVGTDGGFEAAFNLSRIGAGATFRVTVLHDDEQLASTSGEVVEAE